MEFLKDKPSIEYMELFALCAAIFTWEEMLRNRRMTIFCNNQSVVEMVNNMTSSCPHCMVLIRRLIHNNSKYNRRVFVKFVPTKLNDLVDALS